MSAGPQGGHLHRPRDQLLRQGGAPVVSRARGGARRQGGDHLHLRAKELRVLRDPDQGGVQGGQLGGLQGGGAAGLQPGEGAHTQPGVPTQEEVSPA